MRSVLVLIAVSLWGVLALPTAMAAGLPQTAPEQVEWLGEFYMAGLDHYYGRYGLTEEEIQATGADLVDQLNHGVQQPLDSRQLSELSLWLFRSSASVGALDTAPPPLELRDNVSNLANIVGLYLTRPPLIRAQQDQIAGQLGMVLDVLRAAMIEEFSGVPDAQALVRDAVYARAADFGRLIKDPVVPLIKRAYTAEEIDELCAYARAVPMGESASYFDSVSRMDPDAPDFEQQAGETARWTVHGVTWGLRSEVMGVQYTAPRTLSADEEAAVSEYYRNRQGAHSDDFEAKQKRAEEVPW